MFAEHRGLITYYTVVVIDLASRRVQILGSTPHPEALMQQVVRQLTLADEGLLGPGHVLICDRDSKWSQDVRRVLREAGVPVLVTPIRAPNANAYAERFVRSIQDECLSRLIPIGERHFRRAVAEFVEHYHREQNHQGLGRGAEERGAAGWPFDDRGHPEAGRSEQFVNNLLPNTG